MLGLKPSKLYVQSYNVGRNINGRTIGKHDIGRHSILQTHVVSVVIERIFLAYKNILPLTTFLICKYQKTLVIVQLGYHG